MKNFFNNKKINQFFIKSGNPFFIEKKSENPTPPPINEYWIDEDGNHVVDEIGNRVLVF